MAKKIQKVSSGYIAYKAGVTKRVNVELFDLGFYIKYYLDDKLENMTTRNSISKVTNLLNKERLRLANKGWEIKDLGELLVRRDEKTLKFY